MSFKKVNKIIKLNFIKLNYLNKNCKNYNKLTQIYNKNILVRKIIIIRTMMHKNMQSLMGALSLKRSGALTALPMRFRSYGGLKD